MHDTIHVMPDHFASNQRNSQQELHLCTYTMPYIYTFAYTCIYIMPNIEYTECHIHTYIIPYIHTYIVYT